MKANTGQTLTANEKEIVLGTIRLIHWIRRNRINIIVLKGTEATILRPLLRQTWKSMGLNPKKFPKMYATGKLSPLDTDRFEELHRDASEHQRLKVVDQTLAMKLQTSHASLWSDLQNPKNRVGVLDELIEDGRALHTVKRQLHKAGKAKVMSAAFSSIETEPALRTFLATRSTNLLDSYLKMLKRTAFLIQRHQPQLNPRANPKAPIEAVVKERERFRRIGRQARQFVRRRQHPRL